MLEVSDGLQFFIPKIVRDIEENTSGVVPDVLRKGPLPSPIRLVNSVPAFSFLLSSKCFERNTNLNNPKDNSRRHRINRIDLNQNNLDPDIVKWNLITNVMLRLTGRPEKWKSYFETTTYERGRESILRSRADIHSFAQYISDTVGGWDEEINSWTTDQYEALEYTSASARSLFDAMIRFEENVDENFNLVELEKNSQDSFTRDNLLALFVDEVFLPSLHPEDVRLHKEKSCLIGDLVLREMAESFQGKIFSKATKFYSGYGCSEGVDLFIADIKDIDTSTKKGKKLHEIREKVRQIYLHVTNDYSDAQLFLLLLEKDDEGIVRSVINGREFFIYDAEEFACKAGIIPPRTFGTRSWNTPKVHSTHCQPTKSPELTHPAIVSACRAVDSTLMRELQLSPSGKTPHANLLRTTSHPIFMTAKERHPLSSRTANANPKNVKEPPGKVRRKKKVGKVEEYIEYRKRKVNEYDIAKTHEAWMLYRAVSRRDERRDLCHRWLRRCGIHAPLETPLVQVQQASDNIFFNHHFMICNEGISQNREAADKFGVHIHNFRRNGEYTVQGLKYMMEKCKLADKKFKSVESVRGTEGKIGTSNVRYTQMTDKPKKLSGDDWTAHKHFGVVEQTKTLIEDIEQAVKLVWDAKEVPEMLCRLNYLKNCDVVPESPTTYWFQQPHCDYNNVEVNLHCCKDGTESRRESKNYRTPLTCHFPLTENGMCLYVWSDKTEPESGHMLYIPFGSFVLVEGDIFHSGGIHLGPGKAHCDRAHAYIVGSKEALNDLYDENRIFTVAGMDTEGIKECFDPTFLYLLHDNFLSGEPEIILGLPAEECDG